MPCQQNLSIADITRRSKPVMQPCPAYQSMLTHVGASQKTNKQPAVLLPTGSLRTRTARWCACGAHQLASSCAAMPSRFHAPYKLEGALFATVGCGSVLQSLGTKPAMQLAVASVLSLRVTPAMCCTQAKDCLCKHVGVLCRLGEWFGVSPVEFTGRPIGTLGLDPHTLVKCVGISCPFHDS